MIMSFPVNEILTIILREDIEYINFCNILRILIISPHPDRMGPLMSRSSGETSRQVLKENFVCVHCGLAVSGEAPGTQQRNHCPLCLYSRHVDLAVGDRRSGCRGEMEPVAIWSRSGEWVIIHRCVKCGFLRSNRIAGDDSEEA